VDYENTVNLLSADDVVLLVLAKHPCR